MLQIEFTYPFLWVPTSSLYFPATFAPITLIL